MKILHYDAFTSIPNMGNPAGIVLDSPIDDAVMLETAKKVGFNETVFIRPSEKADICLRYFTPGHEMDLCGHGTIAALVAGYETGQFKEIKTIETKAGLLGIEMIHSDQKIFIKMAQNPAQFAEFTGDRRRLAESLSLDPSEIDSALPIAYGNTGIWTLLVPIKRLASFERMKAVNKEFPGILTQFSHSSIHPFCLETYNGVDMHGRHFSSPFSGTIEDIATGTASGVMGAYYLKYIIKGKSVNLKIEQGQEIGKDAIIGVNVRLLKGKYLVEIEGSATFVKEMIL